MPPKTNCNIFIINACNHTVQCRQKPCVPYSIITQCHAMKKMQYIHTFYVRVLTHHTGVLTAQRINFLCPSLHFLCTLRARATERATSAVSLHFFNSQIKLKPNLHT